MKPIFEEERQFLKRQTGIELPKDCWKDGSKFYLDPTYFGKGKENKPILVIKVEDGKVGIKKNNLDLYKKQLTISEVIEYYQDELDNLIGETEKYIVDYIKCNPNHLYVDSISGGKDSSVNHKIFNDTIEKYGLNINKQINFANTSNETADTYKQVFSEVPKGTKGFNILNPKVGYYQWIENKNYFVPSAMVRNCCSTYKEGQVNKFYDSKTLTTMVIGVRKSESSKRKDYQVVMDYDWSMNYFGKSNFPKDWVTFAPIINWDDIHIWVYILKYGLTFNQQYKYGFERCGCLWCPFQSDYSDLLIKEFYPKQYNRWMDVLSKNYISTEVEKRLKWTLEEWQNGQWKQATSKEQFLITKKATPERIKLLSEIKGISEELAEKYFNKKCSCCSKKLNVDEVALNLKLFGRGMDLDKAICGKCYQSQNGINKKEYRALVKQFRDIGCSLF